MMIYSPLFSGSSGNSALLATEKSKILIDAGKTGKALCQALTDIKALPESLDAILITHEHIDHIRGVGVLSRKFSIPIYANQRTWQAMEGQIGEIPQKNIRIFESDNDFFIGDICILPYKIPHDAADPVGYCFESKGRKIIQMTDLGHVPSKIIDLASNSDLILIESNHDEKMLMNGTYPYMTKKRILSNNGHLSNEACSCICQKLIQRNVKRFILGHLSSQNNDERLAFEAVVKGLEEEGAIMGKDAHVVIAKRDMPTGVFKVI